MSRSFFVLVTLQTYPRQNLDNLDNLGIIIMLIQNLQYIDDAHNSNKVKGGSSNEPWWQTGGNLGASTASSYALGTNTLSGTAVKVNIWQGVGSSASSSSISLSFSD